MIFCEICFTKYGENERDSLKLLTKISLFLSLFLGGITKFGDEFVTFDPRAPICVGWGLLFRTRS